MAQNDGASDSWDAFLRNLDASGMGVPPGAPDMTGGMVAVNGSPAIEVMVTMYLVGLLEMLAGNPRAKRRVLTHVAEMNGLEITKPDRRKR